MLIILNNIENFVNFNNMQIIAERANAKVESLLFIYRLRALNFSDNFIDRKSKLDRQRQKIEESLRKQRQMEAMKHGMPQRMMGDAVDDDGSEDEDESNKPDEDDQSSGDVITRRQAELADQLEMINYDFSESGAILSELSSVLDKGERMRFRRRAPKRERAHGDAAAQKACPQQVQSAQDGHPRR